MTKRVLFDDVAAALLESRWIFAKTMPEAPHWYTLRKHWKAPIPFDDVVGFIREHGYRRRYGRSRFTYLNINGMKYWTMGAPIPATILINRAEIEDIHPYDPISFIYDGLFSSEAEQAEEVEAVNLIQYKGGRILDIGCGTGLLLDRAPEMLPGYVGIDPSRGMLVRLEQKHPGAKVVHTDFEHFFTSEPFDYAVALFGVASYIAPDSLPRVLKMLRPGGRFVLMFYSADYEPVVYERSGVKPTLPRYPYEPGLLPGMARRMGPYIVHIGTAP